MLVPRAYGGDEVSPVEYVQAIEEIAKADASTAWCIGQTSVCSTAVEKHEAASRRGDLQKESARRAGLGPDQQRQGDRRKGRLSRQRRLAVRQRQQARHLARRALLHPRAGRRATPRRRRQAGAEDAVRAARMRHMAGRMACDGAERHRQQHLYLDRCPGAGGLLHRLSCVESGRPPRARPALLLHHLPVVRRELSRRRTRHCPGHARCVLRSGAEKDADRPDQSCCATMP